MERAILNALSYLGGFTAIILPSSSEKPIHLELTAGRLPELVCVDA